jgi:Raf kinase inhibitor-like YbhB/YbcL family protein
MSHRNPEKDLKSIIMNTKKAAEATRAVDYAQLQISSPAFEHEKTIPAKYTCDGINCSPPLVFGRIPDEAKCLALIVDDPDAPRGDWVHWVVWNIPLTHHLDEDEMHGVQGLNDFGKNNYGGPCPPSGVHRYFFKIYALNNLLDLPASTTKAQLEKEMSPHIIAFGELMGTYKRSK